MRTLVPGIAVVLAACKPMMPPPNVAFHAGTEPPARGATTAMVIVGLAGQMFSEGVGVAVRVEHQETTRTALGGELTAGKDGSHWLVAVRGYGRGTPRSQTWVAMTYGAGLSVMDVGLVTGTLHGGGAVSLPNDYLVPYLGFGGALAVPLRQPTGKWGSTPLHCPDCGGEPAPFADDVVPTLATELFGYLDAGLVLPISSTGNAVSIDLGIAAPALGKEGLLSLSIADQQTFQ